MKNHTWKVPNSCPLHPGGHLWSVAVPCRHSQAPECRSTEGHRALGGTSCSKEERGAGKRPKQWGAVYWQGGSPRAWGAPPARWRTESWAPGAWCKAVSELSGDLRLCWMVIPQRLLERAGALVPGWYMHADSSEAGSLCVFNKKHTFSGN